MLTREEAADAIILALDCPMERGLELARELEGRLRWVKVGMTMYYREGPAAVRRFRDLGLRVFLDLKLFDIPFQVEGAAASAAATGADLISIHALGGAEMLAAAVQGAGAGAAERGAAEPARTLAITVLTSMDQATLDSIGVEAPVAEEVERLARLAWGSGVGGCVCSPREVRALREALGPDALLVTPGVRPAGADLGDQRRVATPGRAIADGASKIVIGRPLAGADDPRAAFDALVDEIRVERSVAKGKVENTPMWGRGFGPMIESSERLGDEDIRAILDETGAIRHGHFRLTSGRHSDTYVQCARVMESPRTTLRLAEEAVARLPETVRDAVDLVVSPAVGGITFGFAVGLALGVDFMFAERQGGAMTFRRSFEVPEGAKVLVCEDVVTTGGSVKEVIDLVNAAGGEAVGVVSIIDRKTARAFEEPLWPLLELEIPSYEPDDCPLCAQGGEPESLGSRTLASS